MVKKPIDILGRVLFAGDLIILAAIYWHIVDVTFETETSFSLLWWVFLVSAFYCIMTIFWNKATNWETMGNKSASTVYNLLALVAFIAAALVIWRMMELYDNGEIMASIVFLFFPLMFMTTAIMFALDDRSQ